MGRYHNPKDQEVGEYRQPSGICTISPELSGSHNGETHTLTDVGGIDVE
jgi:hypothetical protein